MEVIEQKYDRVRTINLFGSAMARWKPASAAISGAADFRGGPVPDGPAALDPPFSTDMLIFFHS